MLRFWQKEERETKEEKVRLELSLKQEKDQLSGKLVGTGQQKTWEGLGRTHNKNGIWQWTNFFIKAAMAFTISSWWLA